MDEAVFDLLLRGGDHGMGEAQAQLHRHEGDDLQGLARPGGLLNEDRAAGPAHVGDQPGLVGSEFLAGRGVHGDPFG